MNKISFDGRLTRDAEVKFLPNGKSVMSFSVASDVGFGDKKQTNFFNCSRFGENLEKLAGFLVKGSPVTVYGTLTMREYTNKEGVQKYVLDVKADEISMQGGKQDSNQSPPAKKSFDSVKQPKREHAEDFRAENLDDDIPF